MIKSTLVVLTAAASLGLTGCATKQQTGALVGTIVGAAVLGPIGGSAAAHIGAAIVGGVIGNIIGSKIGASMDARDRMLAQDAVARNQKTTITSTSSNAVYVVTPEDQGNGTSRVTMERTQDGKTSSETVIMKKPIRE